MLPEQRGKEVVLEDAPAVVDRYKRWLSPRIFKKINYQNRGRLISRLSIRIRNHIPLMINWQT